MIVVYILRKEIHYYDSMNGFSNGRLDHIKRWLQEESKTKWNNEYNVDDWKLIDRESNVPQQHNGYDCGMFSLLYADFLSDDIPLGNFQQAEILSYRKKVCASILRGKLNF